MGSARTPARHGVSGPDPSAPTAVVQQHLDRERIALDDILASMRKVCMQRFAEVEWAILEADCKISVVPMGTPAAAQRQL